MRAMCFAAAVLMMTIPTQAARAAEPPAGAASCSGCHSAQSGVQTPVPRLEGRNASEIVQQMQAFRTGQHEATVMDRIAKGFSDPEIGAIAAWYAERR